MTYIILNFFLICLNLFGYICDGKGSSKRLSTVLETSFDCNEVERSLTLRGDHIKFSEFTTPYGEVKTYCKNTMYSLKIFATNGITIDRNIRAPGISMFVLAPTWKIIDSRRINLDGKEHPKPLPPNPKKKYLTSASANGVVGVPGLAGNRGGNFVGVGDEITNGEALTISVSGGDGQDGGGGGDGSDGINGAYADKNEIDLNCFVPACHEGFGPQTTPSRSVTLPDNTGKNRQFYCNGSDIETHGLYRYCTFIIYGEDGRASGSGGNSGPGGKRGNPGNIMLFQLGVQSGIKTLNNLGTDGRNGEVGKAGAPGSNGKYAYYKFNTVVISSSRPEKWYEEKPMTNGVDGSVNYGETKQADPYKKIDSSEVANTVVEYKGYLLENIDLSNPTDFKVLFFNKVDQSKAIRSMFDTLALVNELKILEKSFHTSHKTYDFLPQYQSLLNRTDEYSKQPNSQSRSSAEHRKVLTYLYTTILGREYNLKDRSESNLIVDLGGYLDMVLESINKYKESNKIHTIEQYRNNYEKNIHIKIAEADNLIKNDIMPELENALKENTENLDRIIEKILKLEENAKQEIKELRDEQDKFKSTIVMALICDHFKFVAKCVSVLPEFGAAAGLIIENNVDMVEDVFSLNKDVTIPPPKDLFEGAQATAETVSEFRKQAFTDLNNLIKFTIEELEEHPDVFYELLIKVKDIKEKVNKGQTNLNTIEISKLREELDQLIRKEQDKTRGKNNMKNAISFSPLSYFLELVRSFNIHQQIAVKSNSVKRKKNPKDTMTSIGVAVFGGPVVYNLYKKWNEKQGVLNQFNEAIEGRMEFLNQLNKYENSIRNEMVPAVEMMSSNVLNTAKSLGGKSQVSLDVAKWKMQSSLKKMQLGIQTMVKGLNVSEIFTNSFDKIVEALNTLIGVYDRIEGFKEDKKWANYIADIQSAGSNSIKISDGKLRNAINYLDVILNCNMVIKQYQTAVDSFKQYVFPFAILFFAELVLPSYLNYGEDLDGLVITAETQINHIKKKFDEYRFVAKRYDSYIGTGNFNSKYRSTRPFFVWSRNTHSKMISKLLSGKTVTALSDVKQSNPRYDAVKFNEIEFNFKATDKNIQSALTRVLKDFKISAFHTGNSYFRSNDQYFLLITGKLEFWYSFEKDRNGQPVEKALLLDKIKNGAHMLSPYTSWEIQLTHFSERNRQAFEVLNKYRQLVDLELIGGGHFVFKDKLDIDIKVDQYYTPLYNETKPSTG